MAERTRPVRETVWLIDIDEESPLPGSNVIALGLGGKLCETVWNRDSHKFFKAWMPYPKEPESVKRKLEYLYLNGGYGNGVQSNN